MRLHNLRSWVSRHNLSWTTVLCLSLAIPSWCQKPRPNPLVPKAKLAAKEEAVPPAGTHEMTADDVAAFLDGIMPQQLAREDIAGAVVVVVKDGKILFSKGYGYSDVANNRPVLPDGTLFRPGSISKLFTWTAVMQLVEQGKLNLDRNVNDYLDFKIPDTYPQPITLRNVMTHTPGFEEAVQQLFVSRASQLIPLGDYLKEELPARIFPPGTTPAYSNYATAMAGYIVQRVSGEPYDQYIENHILNPLGMTHTTFRQPLPDNLKPLMSKGYEVASAPAKPFEFVEAAPAGSSSVTGDDMARFMIANLQDGEYNGVRILQPATAQLMHSRQFANLPDMNAMALGFYEETRNGHRIIGHGGDTQYFHSDLHLIPDAGVGFFVSYNSAGKGEISPREVLWHAFLNRYYPYTPPAPMPVANSAADAAMVAGRYISSRRSETNILKVLTVVGEAKVSSNPDGTISVNALKDQNGKPKKFREIAPLLFRDVNGQDRVGFKRDAAGRMVAVIDFPFMVFQRAPWYENSALDLPIIVTSLVLMLLTLILWPVAALIRRHYKHRLEFEAGGRRVRLLVRIVCILDLAFVVALGAFFATALGNIDLLSPHYNYLLRLIQIVGWLGVLGTVLVLYNLVWSWKQGARWIWSKIGDTAIALACLGFVWFVFVWNLLHWSLKY